MKYPKQNRNQSQRPRLIFAALTLLALVRGFAQSYNIDWSTVDGGGGTSTGGVSSVSGTIGQPDAGTMSGGNYSLTGGFWSLLSVVQTPGAPALTITLTSTNTALISWPSPSPGFSLQQTTNLNTTNWIDAPESVTDNGAINYIIVNSPAANRFYRLKK